MKNCLPFVTIMFLCKTFWVGNLVKNGPPNHIKAQNSIKEDWTKTKVDEGFLSHLEYVLIGSSVTIATVLILYGLWRLNKWLHPKKAKGKEQQQEEHIYEYYTNIDTKRRHTV